MLYFEFVYIFMKMKFSSASVCGTWCSLILVNSVPIESQNVSGNQKAEPRSGVSTGWQEELKNH